MAHTADTIEYRLHSSNVAASDRMERINFMMIQQNKGCGQFMLLASTTTDVDGRVRFDPSAEVSLRDESLSNLESKIFSKRYSRYKS